MKIILPNANVLYKFYDLVERQDYIERVWPAPDDWVSGNTYAVNDKVTNLDNWLFYRCVEENSDAVFTLSKWQIVRPWFTKATIDNQRKQDNSIVFQDTENETVLFEIMRDRPENLITNDTMFDLDNMSAIWAKTLDNMYLKTDTENTNLIYVTS